MNFYCAFEWTIGSHSLVPLCIRARKATDTVDLLESGYFSVKPVPVFPNKCVYIESVKQIDDGYVFTFRAIPYMLNTHRLATYQDLFYQTLSLVQIDPSGAETDAMDGATPSPFQYSDYVTIN